MNVDKNCTISGNVSCVGTVQYFIGTEKGREGESDSHPHLAPKLIGKTARDKSLAGGEKCVETLALCFLLRACFLSLY